MKKSLVLAICLLQTIALFAQQKFTIHGKADLISASKSIHLGNYTIPIQSDGTFSFTGDVPEQNFTFIRTDKSGMSFVWLEPGNYTAVLKERQNPHYNQIIIDFDFTEAPKTSLIFSHFVTKLNDILIQSSNTATSQKQAAIPYMDSLVKNNSTLKCLPNMIDLANGYVDAASTKRYIAMLSPEMRNDPNIVSVENDINRDEKLKQGIFDDFSMPTIDGKAFKLSSLKNKKVVLIDFWSSSCAPCRAAHPKYVALYKKYAAKGLEIVSISLDDHADAWKNAINQDKIGAWVNVSDLRAGNLNWQSIII
ncbi:TlpA disulfide reductase family protein [Mucilaginibacter sp. dw_454]|uniref:TlpA disulfide reductase family protein n=1 Tax=Mucilaginibacter sp. dw_454 TaxID=2720079 RepID=UPI001BD1F819|nr:TlpA disulfide reductase family protein [Mucilaginibacter sp. dw_454]